MRLLMLPDEILVAILVRVPIESLVRLIFCCKKWRDLILEESFSRLYLRHWTSSSRFCVLFNNPTFFINRHYIYPFNKKAGLAKHLEDCFSRMIRYLTTIDAAAKYRRVLDSCDGLLLIELGFYDTVRSRQLLVCNPVISYFKLLPPANICSECHWNIVYDASIKRYKVVGITREILNNVVGGSSSSSTRPAGWRTVYIFDQFQEEELDLERGGWKKFRETLAMDFGGKIETSLFEKGKLYYLTKHKHIRADGGMSFRTNLIYINVATHKVEATASAYAACAGLRAQDADTWIASNGRFYFTSPFQGNIATDLFVLKDLEGNPIWRRISRIETVNIDGRNVIEEVEPLTVVQHDDDDNYCKMLYLVNGKLYEHSSTSGGVGVWEKVSNGDGGYDFGHFRGRRRHPGTMLQHTFVVRHVHSLIKCN